MEYITIKEVADKWGLSVRRVQTLCNENKISGAVRFGKAWAIPKEVEKPVDHRIKSGIYVKEKVDINTHFKIVNVYVCAICPKTLINQARSGYFFFSLI